MRRQPLKERSDSQSNTIRLVEDTPPRLPTQREERSPSLSRVQERRNQFEEQFSPTSSVFPTLPSQILPPPGSDSSHLFQGRQGSALQDRQDDVSQLAHTTKPKASTGSSASPATTHQPFANSDTPSGQRPKTPRSSKLKTVALRGDKTFSVLDLASVPKSQLPSDWQKTPTRSSRKSATENPHESYSFYPIENDSPTKSATSCTQPSTSATSPVTPIPVTPKQTGKSPVEPNRTPPPVPLTDTNDTEIVGGIRIVPKTPESKKEDELPARTPESVPPLPLASNPPIEEAPTPAPSTTTYPNLITKSSTVSAASENPSEADNYVVYDNTPSSQSETSTVIRHPINPASSSAPESSADSGNYQVIGEPTPTASASSSILAPTESHNSNYEVYGDPSEEGSPSTSSNALVPHPSQDSLAVPPLQPRNRRSHERFGYYKSRSRESLRTATSLASISSVLTQEATRAVVGTASLVQNPPPSSFAIPGSWAEQALSRRQHMQAHPHQWSSQLSTVLSESDVATTDRGSGNFSSGRRSSGFMSSAASRQFNRGSGGSYNSLERPQPAYTPRNGYREGAGSPIRIVGEEHEDGDHLTDMQDLRARPYRSRSGLSFFSSSSSENLRPTSVQSTTSSRANSLLASAIPTWARVYYGSGERRWLAGAPGSSTEGSVSSPPHTPMSHSGSPNTDHFPLSIYSPRRRPREEDRNPNPVSPLRRSLEIEQAPHLDSQGNLIQDDRDGLYARHSRRWRTSSIWSPHLRVDRRATRLSVWQPPSLSWTTEGSWKGRRNIQVIMFVFGFIFPFAWMIAAFLPLPPNPVFVMRERGSGHDVEWSPSHPDLAGPAEGFRPVDEARYESAKWWRRLNRIMSFVGILIIGAIIALAIVGTQDWGKS